jgi:hypothetical protein
MEEMALEHVFHSISFRFPLLIIILPLFHIDPSPSYDAAALLLGLLFVPEDGGSKFLRKLGRLLSVYKGPHPR